MLGLTFLFCYKLCQSYHVNNITYNGIDKFLDVFLSTTKHKFFLTFSDPSNENEKNNFEEFLSEREKRCNNVFTPELTSEGLGMR